ncbi:MAG: FAD-dependent monooxygenase, partial [bacterium]
PLGLSVTVVEAAALDDADDNDNDATADNQPSFDARTVALTYNARQIYTGIGVWPQIAPRAQPITEIHVSDRGHFGMARLRCADAGVEALGYVVPTRAIGAALHRRLRDNDAVEMLCPATVERIRRCGDRNEVSIRCDAEDDRNAVGVRRDAASEDRNAVGVRNDAENGDRSAIGIRRDTETDDREHITLRARLVVLADGGRSGLAAQVGVESPRAAYRQRAIVSIVETDRDTRARAYERFTDEGPLALLPHGARRYAVAWTSAPRHVAARMALSDDDFARALQRAFGDRAGRFARPTARKCYPLHRGRAAHPVGDRAVVIGDAAHIVHPVAGQGFNLGLRDVAALAEAVHRAVQTSQDLGDAATLARYAAARRRETAMVSAFTDGLVRLFASRRGALAIARGIALAGIELLPPAKRLLLRRTMGLRATHSRLGAGLPLAPNAARD